MERVIHCLRVTDQWSPTNNGLKLHKQWSLRLRADVHPPADAVAVELTDWTGEKDDVCCLVAFQGSGPRHRLNSSRGHPCGVDVGDRPEHLDCRCGRGVSTRVASRSRASSSLIRRRYLSDGREHRWPRGVLAHHPPPLPHAQPAAGALCGMEPPPVVPSGSLPSCRSTKR